MGRRSQIRIGAAITIFGLLLLVSNLLQINLWAYVLPLMLIGLGAWLVFKPRRQGRDVPTRFHLLGDIRRHGSWHVRDEDLLVLIGDTDLDFSSAAVPNGETTLHIQGFVGGVRITVPEELGIRIRSTAFVTDAHVLGSNQDYVLVPFEYTSPAYETALRRVTLEILHFVTDLRVRQATPEG